MNFVVFGLQRSGTTYLEELIKLNFANMNVCNTNAKYVWKHHIDPHSIDFNKDYAHIFIYKNLYQWIESVIRNKVDIDRRHGFNIMEPGDHMLHGFNLVNLSKLYHNYHQNWIGFIDNNDYIVKIKYETLLSNIDELRKIMIKFNLTKISDKWINIDKVYQSRKFTNNIKDYYLNNKFDYLNEQHIHIINTAGLI